MFWFSRQAGFGSGRNILTISISYEISPELRIGESPENAGRKPVSWIFGFGINAKSLTEARAGN
jgi:hypothetical protein